MTNLNSPDLAEIEQVLFTLATDSIRQFAAEHGDKRFYAFAFDCNAEYGDVLLCVNTEADFEATAREYVAKWNYSTAELASLKRNTGDWKYQGFNLDQPAWREGWAPYQDAVEQTVFGTVELDDTEDGHDEDEGDAPDSDLAIESGQAFTEDFMRCCCRVMVRIEHCGVLNLLKQAPGFFTHVQDHDESDDDAIQRLASVRAEGVA